MDRVRAVRDLGAVPNSRAAQTSNVIPTAASSTLRVGREMVIVERGLAVEAWAMGRGEGKPGENVGKAHSRAPDGDVGRWARLGPEACEFLDRF